MVYYTFVVLQKCIVFFIESLIY